MGLHRILWSSVFVCALVLPLVSCGANPTTSTATSNSSAAGLTASPQTNSAGTSPQSEGAGTTPQAEGTGPESPQAAGNGGVSVPLAKLPIGDGGQEGDNLGNNECVRVAVLGKINHPGVELTVTVGVGVTDPFTKVDSAAAGCPQGNPPCEGTKFTIANDSAGATCYAGVQYTGPSLSDTSPDVTGTIWLDGDVSCQNVDSTTCNKYRDEVLQSGISANGQSSVSISFTGPTTTDGGSPPSDGGSPPSDGGSPPSDGGSPQSEVVRRSRTQVRYSSWT